MKLFGAQNMYSELKTVLMKKPNPFMSKADSKKWNYDISWCRCWKNLFW